MRWSYKTVHFELKKDGLLGGAFLDDAEIEETLNEYGQGGWELVSMFETRDGVIAAFKQPLDLDFSRSYPPHMVEKSTAGILTEKTLVEEDPDIMPDTSVYDLPEQDEERELDLPHEPEAIYEKEYEEDEEYEEVESGNNEGESLTEDDREEQEDGIGSIRIE